LYLGRSPLSFSIETELPWSVVEISSSDQDCVLFRLIRKLELRISLKKAGDAMKLILSLISMVLSTSQVFAETDPKVRDYVICKNQKVVRTILIFDQPGGGCQVTYSKAGIDRVVGNAKSSASCQSISDNIKSNLESSSWRCREVQSASVMGTAEAKDASQSEVR